MRANMKVCGMQIRVSGRFLRTARLDADRYQFIEGDPELVLDELRKSDGRIDLFTFLQRLPDAAPKFSYPMKWDNFAAITIPSFDDWWMKQLGFKARNKAKQAEKKGVVIREVPFDDDLVRGIWGIYNECPVRQGRPFSHYGKSLETVFREVDGRGQDRPAFGARQAPTHDAGHLRGGAETGCGDRHRGGAPWPRGGGRHGPVHQRAGLRR